MKRNSWVGVNSWIILAAAGLSCALFIMVNANESGIGFPLDDAWIHHTFARNFAESLEWSFLPGTLSGGSTGPLWGLLLSVIYWLGADPIWGTYLLGWLLLSSAGLVASKIGESLVPEKKYAGLFCGLALVLEWHLVWAALSGMETILLGLLSLVLFWWLRSGRQDWWVAGLLIGGGIWIRPDALTLMGPALFVLGVRGLQGKEWKKPLVMLIIAAGAMIGPYFWFNSVVAGDIWPNTFYAKQAEYAFLQEEFFLRRLGTVSYQVAVGAGALLLPGLILEARKSLPLKRPAVISLLLWAAGYIVIYAWRLPVAYQHGRYIMPVMPVIFLLGTAGLIRTVQLEAASMVRRLISRSWFASSVLVLIGFLILGARSYAQDVGVINTEMVRAARWVAQNTPEDAIIAAHDIGALGYFGNRDIRDLAGLVSPDVIPIFWDEPALKQYLDQQGVDYLFTFMDWYSYLTPGLDIAYQTEGQYAPAFGMENIAVYYWNN